MAPRIAVVGAGAVGGYVGGNMKRAGHDVTMIDPWPEHVEAIRAHGLHLYGRSDEECFSIDVPTMHLTELQSLSKQRPIDIAIVSVKSYDTEWAPMMIRQYLAPGGYIVSLQNCMNEERIAGVVGWGRVVGCIAAAISVELYEAGHIRRMVPRGGNLHTVFRVGEVHGRSTKRVEELAAMIESCDSTKVTTNLWGERWSKLCLNGMRNGVSAATGLGGNEMDRDDAIRRFCIKLGGEAVRVGQALGFELEHIGKLDPDRLARASEGDRTALEEVEAILAAGSNTASRAEVQRPSMGQDMVKGRRTEIEFMNGLIAEKGAEAGIATPAHVALVEAVKRVERGELPARPENISKLCI